MSGSVQGDECSVGSVVEVRHPDATLSLEAELVEMRRLITRAEEEIASMRRSIASIEAQLQRCVKRPGVEASVQRTMFHAKGGV